MDILLTLILVAVVIIMLGTLLLSFGGFLMARIVWGTMKLGAFLAKLVMAAGWLIVLFVLLKYAGG